MRKVQLLLLLLVCKECIVVYCVQIKLWYHLGIIYVSNRHRRVRKYRLCGKSASFANHAWVIQRLHHFVFEHRDRFLYLLLVILKFQHFTDSIARRVSYWLKFWDVWLWLDFKWYLFLCDYLLQWFVYLLCFFKIILLCSMRYFWLWVRVLRQRDDIIVI